MYFFQCNAFFVLYAVHVTGIFMALRLVSGKPKTTTFCPQKHLNNNLKNYIF